MPPLDRRRFIQLGASAAAVGVAGDGWRAMPRATGPWPSTHRFRLGAMEVTIVNDGLFQLPLEVFAPDVEREERDHYFGARQLLGTTIPVQLCPVLLHTGTERILVDTGLGAPHEAAPDAGWLTSGFPATGSEPEAIDLVVLTHAHEDHYGGLVDPATGRSRFPNADIVIARAELEFWTDPDVATRRAGLADTYGGPASFEAFLARTAAMLEAVGERLRPVEAGAEIAAGIRLLDSPGHTAGHAAVLAESEGERLLLVGDAITNIHVAFERPRWRLLFDDHGDEAIRTRLRLLEWAAAEGALLSGYHFPFPGVGRVLRDGDAYRWLPVVV